jgi:hypothetical protein
MVFQVKSSSAPNPMRLIALKRPLPRDQSPPSLPRRRRVDDGWMTGFRATSPAPLKRPGPLFESARVPSSTQTPRQPLLYGPSRGMPNHFTKTSRCQSAVA